MRFLCCVSRNMPLWSEGETAVTEISSPPLTFFEHSGTCYPIFQPSPYRSLKTQLNTPLT